MQNSSLYNKNNFTISGARLTKNLYLIISVIITFIRLVLTNGLFIKFASGSVYDDLLQITKAFSFANGDWMGEYGPLTLVKGVGFPVFAGLFSMLGIPYLIGFTIIYIIGCALFVYALAPLIKNSFIRLAAYALLLFNPILFATDITRYYRDVLYAPLCMICIAAIICFFTRDKGLVTGITGGISLALCALTREDNHWLYIYTVACIIVSLILKLKKDKAVIKNYILRVTVFTAGYFIIILSVCFTNFFHYQTFTTDEYNSGSYAKAYGALSRLNGGEENSRIVIPYSQRQKLYEHCPSFAQLKEILDGENTPLAAWKQLQGEYAAGYFSFTLRTALHNIGYFKDAPSTNAFLNQMADEINDYCDTLGENAGRPRSGITARFYSHQIPDILSATFAGAMSNLSFTNVSCIPVPCAEDDEYLRLFEDFTHSTVAANRYVPDKGVIENYQLSGLSLWCQRINRVLIIAYSYITTVIFFVSFACTIMLGILYFNKRYKEKSAIAFWSSLSLLCLYILRCAMIGFVDATTFSAIGNPAYQAASYIVLIAYCAFQLSLAATAILSAYKKKSADPS